ncbi:MAG: matrixin family metalloprotease [Planctomycetes bacterium]|nr:matrixin family metalloprotease [Planctomycetota bacterium]
MITPRQPLTVEQLEDRCVPATWNNPWPDAAHLTLSFAPDSTVVGDRTSTLFSTLNRIAATTTWQREILRAFQTWAVQANINLGIVADGGQAFGSAGRPQGDPRFGDIRLGAFPQAQDELATASPFDATAGTWSGDVKFNTSYNFSIGGAGGVDLFTAALHEAAHTFGLDHSSDSASAVFEDYLGPRTAPLTSEDISRLQALYGARNPDSFEGSTGNETLATATRLNLLSNSDGSAGIQVGGDITTASDLDVYRFAAPLNAGSMNIRLHTAGISLLTARVTVFDSSGKVVGSAVSTDPLNNELTIRISSPKPLGTYYVKVEGAGGNVFSIGSYNLEIQSIPLLGTTTNLLSETTQTALQLLNNDLHTNDSFLTAALIPPLTTQTSSHFDYAYRASISDKSDVDFYRLQAPTAPAGQSTVMTVMLWGMENNGLVPRASVYDANQNLVQGEVLVNENGIFTLQVRNAVAGATYYVEVEAADPNGPNNVGNYFLGIDFSTQAVDLQTVTQGTLSSSHPDDTGTLTVTQQQLFHLVLAVNAPNGSTTAGVKLTIQDAAGNVVATLIAMSGGDPVSLTQILGAGTYTIRFTAFTTDGSPVPALNYSLKALGMSDPIGPQPQDSTTQPSGTTSTSSTSTDTSTSTTTSSSSSTSGTDSTSDTSSNYYYSPSGSGDPYSQPYTTV